MRRFLRSIRLLVRDMNRAQATARGRFPSGRDGIGTIFFRQVLSGARWSSDGWYYATLAERRHGWHPMPRVDHQVRYPPLHLSSGQPRGGE